MKKTITTKLIDMRKAMAIAFLVTVIPFTACAQKFSVNNDQITSYHGSSGMAAGKEGPSIPLFDIPFGGSTIPLNISYTMEPPKFGGFCGLVGDSWYFNFQNELAMDVKAIYADTTGTYLNTPNNFIPEEVALDGYLTNRHIGYVSYNIMGSHGIFFDNNQWVSEFPDKFKYVPHPQTGAVNSVVHDDRGWAYHFGDSIINARDSLQRAVIASAMLTQIMAPNGDTLTIHYAIREMTSPDKRINIHITEPIMQSVMSYIGEQVNIDTVDMPSQYIYYPTSISFPEGSVTINYDLGDDYTLISGMTLYLGGAARQVEFTYEHSKRAKLLTQVNFDNVNYYHFGYNMEGTVLDPNHQVVGKAHLDSLRMAVNSFNEYELHEEYFAQASDLSPFPWYVGDFVYYKYIPSITGPEVEPSYLDGLASVSMRDTKPFDDGLYLLKTMVNPTGGQTHYSYEPHDEAHSYDVYSGLYNRGPGVRIKGLVNLDINGDTLQVRDYQYENGRYFPYDSMDGSHNRIALRSRYIRQKAYIYVRYEPDPIYYMEFHPAYWLLSHQYMISNVPLGDEESAVILGTKGIYYDKVTVTDCDTAGAVGKTEYHYDIASTLKRNNSYAHVNMDTNPHALGPTPRYIYPSFITELTVGDGPTLSRKVTYESIGQTFRPVQKEDFSYSKTERKANAVFLHDTYYEKFGPLGELPPTSMFTDCNLLPNGTGNGVEHAKYKLTFVRKDLAGKKTTIYNYND